MICMELAQMKDRMAPIWLHATFNSQGLQHQSHHMSIETSTAVHTLLIVWS
jgi:hypothetical protein